MYQERKSVLIYSDVVHFFVPRANKWKLFRTLPVPANSGKHTYAKSTWTRKSVPALYFFHGLVVFRKMLIWNFLFREFYWKYMLIWNFIYWSEILFTGKFLKKNTCWSEILFTGINSEKNFKPKSDRKIFYNPTCKLGLAHMRKKSIWTRKKNTSWPENILQS